MSLDPLSQMTMGSLTIQQMACLCWWHDELVANEKRWIKEANDPDKAFAKVYYKAPVVSNYEPPWWLLLLMDKVVMRILLFFGVALLAGQSQSTHRNFIGL